jgi:acyl-CoA thioesterase I
MFLRLPTLLLSVFLLSVACLPASGRAQSAPPPRLFVAIGASDTVGVGAHDPDAQGWVPRLYGRLPTGSRLVNLGVSGTTLHEAIDQQLPVALATQPDLVTVWLAVNDLNARVPLDRYAADLETLLAALDSTQALVLVANVPDVTLLPSYRGQNASALTEEVRAWNSVIAATVVRHHAVQVDLYARWREVADHPEYISADGFHPSSAGYDRLAQLFWEIVEQHADAFPHRD